MFLERVEVLVQQKKKNVLPPTILQITQQHSTTGIEQRVQYLNTGSPLLRLTSFSGPTHFHFGKRRWSPLSSSTVLADSTLKKREEEEAFWVQDFFSRLANFGTWREPERTDGWRTRLG